MNAQIGDTVVVAATKQFGIVTALSETYHGAFVVKVWDHKKQRYKKIETSPLGLIVVNNPLIIAMTNDQDRKALDSYHEAAIDLAIQTGDKKWLDEIGERMKKLTKETKERG